MVDQISNPEKHPSGVHPVSDELELVESVKNVLSSKASAKNDTGTVTSPKGDLNLASMANQESDQMIQAYSGRFPNMQSTRRQSQTQTKEALPSARQADNSQPETRRTESHRDSDGFNKVSQVCQDIMAQFGGSPSPYKQQQTARTINATSRDLNAPTTFADNSFQQTLQVMKDVNDELDPNQMFGNQPLAKKTSQSNTSQNITTRMSQAKQQSVYRRKPREIHVQDMEQCNSQAIKSPPLSGAENNFSGIHTEPAYAMHQRGLEKEQGKQENLYTERPKQQKVQHQHQEVDKRFLNEYSSKVLNQLNEEINVDDFVRQHKDQVINLEKLRGQNIDNFVQPMSPVEQIIYSQQHMESVRNSLPVERESQSSLTVKPRLASKVVNDQWLEKKRHTDFLRDTTGVIDRRPMIEQKGQKDYGRRHYTNVGLPHKAVDKKYPSGQVTPPQQIRFQNRPQRSKVQSVQRYTAQGSLQAKKIRQQKPPLFISSDAWQRQQNRHSQLAHAIASLETQTGTQMTQTNQRNAGLAKSTNFEDTLGFQQTLQSGQSTGKRLSGIGKENQTLNANQRYALYLPSAGEANPYHQTSTNSLEVATPIFVHKTSRNHRVVNDTPTKPSMQTQNFLFTDWYGRQTSSKPQQSPGCHMLDNHTRLSRTFASSVNSSQRATPSSKHARRDLTPSKFEQTFGKKNNSPYKHASRMSDMQQTILSDQFEPHTFVRMEQTTNAASLNRSCHPIAAPIPYSQSGSQKQHQVTYYEHPLNVAHAMNVLLS